MSTSSLSIKQLIKELITTIDENIQDKISVGIGLEFNNNLLSLTDSTGVSTKIIELENKIMVLTARLDAMT
jgi:hypothetical protein